MKRDTAVGKPSIPADRIAEASVWVTRLHGDDRDAAMEAGFRQWLSSNADNRTAFELATEVWEESANLKRVIPFAHDVPKPRHLFRSPVTAIAAAAVLAVAFLTAAFWYLEHREVVTAIGEQRLLVLDDGSRIFLNTATRLAVNYTEGVRHIELKAGEALFDVAKDPARPFIVEAGNRKVTALGTSFVVRHDTAVTAVTLVEGKVSVTPVIASSATQPNTQTNSQRTSRAARPAGTAPAGSAETPETVTLLPGQRLTYTDHASRVESASVDEAIAWRRGQVVLDDLPLEKAVEEMNRYSTVKLTVERPEAAALIVNGLFQAGDSMSFATAVSQTYGLQLAVRGDEIALMGVPATPEAKSTEAR